MKKRGACCGAHSSAEVYACLTGMPGKERASADEAMLFFGNMRERLTVVTLTGAEYFKAMAASAEVGVAAGSIYDALLAHCALRLAPRRSMPEALSHTLATALA